jgi:hypothetical protein
MEGGDAIEDPDDAADPVGMVLTMHQQHMQVQTAPHTVCFDSHLSVYVAEVLGQLAQHFLMLPSDACNSIDRPYESFQVLAVDLDKHYDILCIYIDPNFLALKRTHRPLGLYKVDIALHYHIQDNMQHFRAQRMATNRLSR